MEATIVLTEPDSLVGVPVVPRIPAAEGSWIALCDDDIVWGNDELERQPAKVAAHPHADLIVGNVTIASGIGVSPVTRTWRRLRCKT